MQTTSVIIGSTTLAMLAAICLRSQGHEVSIVPFSAFFGEDFTGIWRCYPLNQQKEGRLRLHACMGEEFMLSTFERLILRIDIDAHGNFSRMLSLTCA